MILLAIDPGPVESAYVVYDGQRPVEFGKVTTNEMLYIINTRPVDALVIEQVCSYGMAVGEEIFETVFQSGRFWEAFFGHEPRGTTAVRCSGRLPRLKVKLHLCADSKARDPNIRQALIDRFGGREAAVGKKKKPGPLYGVSGDVWAALAVAITWWETEVRLYLSGARRPGTQEPQE